MPARRLSMRKVREVLRLSSTTQLSHRQIARSVGLARSTVSDYLGRLSAAGLQWPLPEHVDDSALEELLFVSPSEQKPQRPLPEWSEVHRELQRKGVTLRLLWLEYKATHPDGYHYSRYCEIYGQWCGALESVMRQSHKAGERLFVDYAGVTIPVVDASNGEVRQAQVFVAAFGASNYTYCEATWTQELSDWIGSHQRAFSFFGGVPEIVVPDNLKSGVSKAHRYDPEINRSYAEMAEHYGVAILPARVRKPRDKAKVESAVQVVERSILAVLRDRTFFSLVEVNRAIAALLAELNNREFQKLSGSRRSAFDEIDRPALKPLPIDRYEFAEWRKIRVGNDYHIDVNGHGYSVPSKHLRQQLDVRISETTVEFFLKSRRIAVHMRSHQRGGHTTVAEHMPESHRQYAAQTPEKIIDWASSIGSATEALARSIIAGRAHPEQGYRACLGILRLGKAYGNDRLESAARRALSIGATRYESIESILKNGLDRQALAADSDEAIASITHDNLRGAAYYTAATEAGAPGRIDPPAPVDLRINNDHLSTGGTTHVEHAHA